MLFRWLASGSGLGALHRFLWIAVDQYTYRSLSSAAYNHVMSLSFDFHSNVSKGELYSSVHRGRSINGFIDLLLFSVFPMFTDFVVAFTYFYFMFGTYMALIVTFVSITYVWVTAKLSRKRERIRFGSNPSMM